MAEKTSKVTENIPGAWYVDTNCTPCRTCLEVPGAEDLIQWNDDESYVFFHAQPTDADQIATAEEMMAVCPQAAIGDDGAE